jgi:phosphatidylserine/phosphatidylglycerophosphate/cardiolipin synthase-like enzyme
LLNLINNAKESIYFAIYGIGNQDAIFNALVEAKKRGVKVRGVTDVDENNKNIYKDTPALMQSMGDMKTDYVQTQILEAKRKEHSNIEYDTLNSNKGYIATSTYNLGDKKLATVQASKEKFEIQQGIMHDKFFIFDKSIVWTGSTNVSSTCMNYNANNVALIKNKEIANIYQQEFNQMYEQELFHNTKHPIANNKNIKLKDGSIVSIYFSPENKAIYEGFKPLIKSAQKNIYVSIFFFTHPYLTQLLIDAHKRGVDVKVIVDANGASSAYSKHEILRGVGIPVKVENWGGKMHMKSMTIDDKYTIIGSMNWTNSAQNINDENTVIIENKAIAEKLKDNFLFLWKSIPDKWLKGRPLPESWDSINSCSDGIDNDYDGLLDAQSPYCKNTFFHHQPKATGEYLPLGEE